MVTTQVGSDALEFLFKDLGIELAGISFDFCHSGPTLQFL